MGSPPHRDQLDQTVVELYVLHELAKLLVSSIELEQVVGYILDGLRGLMDTESSFLYDYELESGTLNLLAARGNVLDLPDSIPITASHWIARAATAQAPVTLTSGDLMLAVISLRAHDTIQGVLGIGTDAAYQFTPTELDRLAASSHLAAMALENARLYARIQALAITDGLTGLYNHRHFFHELHREMNRARRFNIPLSLLILDIDHFKEFNDTFGHIQGDEVLRIVARTLCENIRGSDLAARYGGDEFAAILPSAGPDQARRVAERIRRCIAQIAFHGDTPLTVSVGVAGLDVEQDVGESPQGFAHRADRALYYAKQASRNRVCVYGERVGEDDGGDDT